MNDLPAGCSLLVRRLGRRSYRPVLSAMQALTARRRPDQADELWAVQHPAVFTLGQNASPEHVLRPGDIPVVQVDRGGQVTYHGPGQLVIYPLLDLRRLGLGIRKLVAELEGAVMELLARRGIEAARRPGAPGVYVADAKVAALGLRVRRGCSYHGLSFNVDMDMEPFQRINPCGFQGLRVTQLRDLIGPCDLATIEDELITILAHRLGYTQTQSATPPHPIEDA